ncbi:general odorant-binding protein 19d-like [Eurosta solidaginis]|uniref:general odorant-binding protein 19d-like n=1 Tax=Eurosta solidaginis TaxID=178769 RepID=UPI00353155F6
MKYFVVFLVACTLATSYAQNEMLDKAKAIAETCKTETGASDEDVVAMFKHEPAGNDKAKCLHACALKKFGLYDDSNNINNEAAMGIVKTVAAGDANLEKQGLEALDACKDTPTSGNNCEVAEAYRACFIAKSKENGFKLPF